MPRFLGGFITYDTANVSPSANTLRSNGGVFTLADHIQYLRANSWPEIGLNVEYLIVAGGGGGGANHAGGGGAGGLLYSTASLKYNSTYTITVGAGGSRATSYTSIRGYQGANSSLTSNVLSTYTSNIISVGGGGGGNRHDYAVPAGTIEDGGPGGSGGGGGGLGTSNLTGDTGGLAGAGISGQGFPGGSAAYHAGAGGGGAGGPGQSTGSDANGSLGGAAGTNYPGNGGPGRYIQITGANVAYAGGGGGGGYINGPYVGAGGVGGGGTGQLSGSSPVNGTDGLGGGGGGANGGGNANGGNGGSGVVILAYQGPQAAIGGAVSTISRPGYTVHTFNNTGSLIVFPNSIEIKDSLALYYDVSMASSYPGSGSTIYDVSGNSRNGTLDNCTYSSTNGGYLSFNGSSSRIRVGAVTSGLSQDITYSIWFLRQGTGAGVLFWDDNSAGGGDAWVQVNANNTIESQRPTDGFNVLTTTSAITTGVWTNFTFVAKSSSPNKSFYINGVLNTSDNIAIASRSGISYVTIGHGYDGGSNVIGNWLQGYVAKFSIYGRALTAAEVSKNFYAVKDRFGI